MKGANFEPGRSLHHLRRRQPDSGPAEPAAAGDQRRRPAGHSRPGGRPQPRRLPDRLRRLILCKFAA